MIVGVGAKAVTSPEETVKAIRAATSGGADQAVALRIIRDGQPAFVGVNPQAAGPNQG